MQDVPARYQLKLEHNNVQITLAAANQHKKTDDKHHQKKIAEDTDLKCSVEKI